MSGMLGSVLRERTAQEPEHPVAAMAQDPILSAFDALVEKAAEAPLFLTPQRTATVGDLAELARAAGSVLAARPGTPS